MCTKTDLRCIFYFHYYKNGFSFLEITRNPYYFVPEAFLYYENLTYCCKNNMQQKATNKLKKVWAQRYSVIE